MKKRILYFYTRIILYMSGIIILSSIECYANHFNIIKGNRLYKKGYYSDALNNYKSEIKRHPDNQIAIFNAANSLYKMENYTTAIDYYRRLLLKLKDKKIKSMVYYNMGNSFYRLGEYKEAVKNYLKALDLNPYNIRIKQNLEIAAEKLKNNRNVKNQNYQIGKNSNREKPKEGSQEKKQSKNESPTTNPKKEKTKKALTEEEAKEILRSIEQKNQYQLQEIIKHRLKKESNDEKGW